MSGSDEMSTEDCMILLAPFATLLVGMFIAFGIQHYNDVKGLRDE
jgi:hypothetical protein